MIQIYLSKNNFDAQKAQRFFKERRIPVQVMDLKKHKLGQRELELFAGLPIFAVICGRSIRDAADPGAEVQRMKEHIDQLWN